MPAALSGKGCSRPVCAGTTVPDRAKVVRPRGRIDRRQYVCKTRDVDTRTRWVGGALVTAAALAGWWSLREPPRQVAGPEPAEEPAPPAAPMRAAAPDAAAAPLAAHSPENRPAPNSGAALAPGQALREVRALVDQQKIGAARALAEHYLNEIPDGEEAAQIKSLTGVHPHP
jgi:hypothetical protein